MIGPNEEGAGSGIEGHIDHTVSVGLFIIELKYQLYPIQGRR